MINTYPLKGNVNALRGCRPHNQGKFSPKLFALLSTVIGWIGVITQDQFIGFDNLEGLAGAGRALFAAFCVEESGSSEDHCRFGLLLFAGSSSFPSILTQPMRCNLLALHEGGLLESCLLSEDRC